MAIGENLKTLRQRCGMTQQQAADKLGVTRQTVSSYESDRTMPDIEMLKALAAVYGTDIDEIISDSKPLSSPRRWIKTAALIFLALLTVLTIAADSYLYAANRFLWAANGYKPIAGGNVPEGPMPGYIEMTSVWAKLDSAAGVAAVAGGILLLAVVLITRCRFTAKQKAVYLALLAAGLLLPAIIFGALDPIYKIVSYLISPAWTFAKLVLIFLVLLIAEAIKKSGHTVRP